MSPQFKTWFYIYKNNTVEADFKAVIEKYYSVDVKEIKRFDFDEPSESETTEFSYPTADPTEGLQFPDEKSKIEESSETKTDLSNTFKKLKLAIVKAEENHQKNSFNEQDKESSKFDRVVEDKQYEEVVKIREQMKDEDEKKKEEGIENCDNKEAVDTIKDEITKADAIKEEKKDIKVDAPVPEKDIEILQAAESHPIKKRVSIL